MLSGLRDDDRGLALGIVVFFAMIIVAALLYALASPAMSEILAFSSERAAESGGSQQVTTAETIWNNLLFVALFLAALFIIARAVREGAVGP